MGAGGSTGVNLVTNPVISNEQGKDLIVVKKTTNGTYHGHLKHRYPVLVNQVMTSTKTIRTLGSVASFLAATLYQIYHDRNHKLLNIGSTEIYILHMQVLSYSLHSLDSRSSRSMYGTQGCPQPSTLIMANMFACLVDVA